MKHLFLLLALILALAPITVEAHRVSLFAYENDGQIYTESSFPDGRPVSQGRILVSDSAGREILTGETDAAGRFHFPRPQARSLKIQLKATMGHHAEFQLRLNDVEE